MTALDIITGALQEINAVAQGETVPTGDASFALTKLNDLLDEWAARRVFIFDESFPSFTLTPALNPHTIGPTGATFTTPSGGQRPQRIEQATLILNNVTPVVDIPLNIRDAEWWMNQRVKTLQTNVPTDLFYDPDWPNGSIYLWPVPSTAYGIRLKLWGIIPQFPAYTTTFSLPPGYQKGIKMSLARDLVGPYKGTWSEQQESSWMRAMKAIESNNIKSPRGSTVDAGMPSNRTKGTFNYYSSQPS